MPAQCHSVLRQLLMLLRGRQRAGGVRAPLLGALLAYLNATRASRLPHASPSLLETLVTGASGSRKTLVLCSVSECTLATIDSACIFRLSARTAQMPCKLRLPRFVQLMWLNQSGALRVATVLGAGADGPVDVTVAQLDDVQADIDAGNAALLQESTFLIDLLAADATGPLSPPVRLFWVLALLITFNNMSLYIGT